MSIGLENPTLHLYKCNAIEAAGSYFSHVRSVVIFSKQHSPIYNVCVVLVAISSTGSFSKCYHEIDIFKLIYLNDHITKTKLILRELIWENLFWGAVVW